MYMLMMQDSEDNAIDAKVAELVETCNNNSRKAYVMKKDMGNYKIEIDH